MEVDGDPGAVAHGQVLGGEDVAEALTLLQGVLAQGEGLVFAAPCRGEQEAEGEGEARKR